MKTYQRMEYKGEKFDEKFGWEFGKVILFQSAPHADPATAMKEFNAFQLPDDAWFAYMRKTENGEIVDEELFDSCWIDGHS